MTLTFRTSSLEMLHYSACFSGSSSTPSSRLIRTLRSPGFTLLSDVASWISSPNPAQKSLQVRPDLSQLLRFTSMLPILPLLRWSSPISPLVFRSVTFASASPTISFSGSLDHFGRSASILHGELYGILLSALFSTSSSILMLSPFLRTLYMTLHSSFLVLVTCTRSLQMDFLCSQLLPYSALVTSCPCSYYCF